MPDLSMHRIVLDTLGGLHAFGHRLSGWCLDCSARYRMDVPAAARRPASFEIDLPQLIAEPGRQCRVLGLAPVVCPYCGSSRTEHRILPPER
jgi:hypothetical protein